MTTPIFTTAHEGSTYHTIILGTSGQGKSVLLQAEAKRLGITYEELLQRLGPTEEQKERQRMRQEEEDRAEDQRLNAVAPERSYIAGNLKKWQGSGLPEGWHIYEHAEMPTEPTSSVHQVAGRWSLVCR